MGRQVLDRWLERLPLRRRPILAIGLAIGLGQFASLVFHPDAGATPAPTPRAVAAGETGQTPERSVPSAGESTTAETSDFVAGDALREGNRLFRAGDLEAAVAAYRSRTDDDVAGTIAYNLGTTFHHLGRLPEAVLWYRRAESRLNTDPWLRENLDRARLELEAPALAPPWLVGQVDRHPWLAPATAAAMAWIGLGLALRRSRRRRAIVCLGLSATIWIAILAFDRFGPRPAVVTTDCSAAIPAGSEVWVRSHSDGWRLSGGTEALCGPQSVSLIDP